MAGAALGRTPKPTKLSKTNRARNPCEARPDFLSKADAKRLGAEFLIGAEAQRLWPHLVEPLRTAQLATVADKFALLELAESIGEMREARVTLQGIDEQLRMIQGGTDLGGGATLLDESVERQVSTLERRKAALKLDIKWAYERVRDLMAGMGCTPAARSKIKVDDAQGDMFADAMRMIDVTFHDGDDDGSNGTDPGAVSEQS